jgi:hypothetical protein
MALDGGGVVVGEKIKIFLEVEAVLQKAEITTGQRTRRGPFG